MQSKCAIRPATVDDFAATTDIYAHAVSFGTASFEVDPPAQPEMLNRYQAIVEKGFPYLVAVLDGRVVGYAYANAYRPRPAYRFTVEDSIYVHPDQQGTGVGRALLSVLIERCTAMGMRQMIGVIGDSQSKGSIALHTTMGFSLIGVARSVGYKHGRWLDQVLMQINLGAGDETAPDPLP